MIIRVEKRDLFNVDKEYCLAHCISSDCAMGAGIAVKFQSSFRLRESLLSNYEIDERKHPTCIFDKNVLNLITKAKYYEKPTYESLQISLETMKKIAIKNDIKKIAMPKIGCGLDRLQWGNVREIIEDIFKDTDIEFLICYL